MRERGTSILEIMKLSRLWPFRGSVPTFDVDNIVGRGTHIRGELCGPGGFRIDGTVTGMIQADGPIVVGVEGYVEGNLNGRDVVVLGRVQGDVRASRHLEIGPDGRVMGDITV